MARDRLGDGFRLATQMDEDTRDIPRSTITAQIVEQHAHPRSQDEADSGSAFAQLLEEVRANPASIEADVQANYQLIRVVAEAGLDALKNSNPFEASSNKEERAVACVEVIEIAIHRNPEVLYYDGLGAEEYGSQLSLWLPLKLFDVLEMNGLSALRASLWRLMALILNDLRAAIHHAKGYNKLLRLFKLYAEESLSALDQANSTGLRAPLIFPTEEAQEIVCGEQQQPIALQRGCQVAIKTFVHAITVTVALVRAISSGGGSDPMATAPAIAAPKTQLWAVRAMSRLIHRVLVLSNSLSQADLEDVLSVALMTMCDISREMLQGKQCRIVFRKVALAMTECAAISLSKPSSFGTLTTSSALVDVLDLVCGIAEQSTSVLQEVKLRVIPQASLIANDGARFAAFPVALQRAITRLLSSHESNLSTHITSKNNSTMHFKVPGAVSGNHKSLANDHSERPIKRRKTTDKLVDSRFEMSLSRLCQLLGDWDPGNLSGLGDSTAGLFSDLPEADKREVLKLLLHLPCLSVGYTTLQSTDCKLNMPWSHCECQKDGARPHSEQKFDSTYWGWLQEILSGLTESNALQSHKSHRVILMKAVSTFVRHTTISQHHDLSESTLGKWCLQNLRSSSREVRLAAGYALPSYLLSDPKTIDLGLLRKNRVTALEILRQLAATNDPRYLETVIVALGQAACVCGDEEMNIILLRLIEYLGHANSLVCCMAHLEIRSIAQTYSTSLEDLIKPFWKSIAIVVVKDLLSRPQKTQQLSDLLGMTVSQFLCLTQTDTLPYLVLWKKQNILERFAKLVGSVEASVWSLCMIPQNLTAILAMLVVQNPSDMENTALGYLSQASSGFKNENVANLLKMEPISVACEVLKNAGDEDSAAREKALEGFQALTVIVEKRGHQAKTASTQARMSELFFENHALGIMASFSDVIENPNQSRIEKKRCLRAIQQMISVARGNIQVALPQIRACLQSALEDRALRDESFTAWLSLLSALESDEDIQPLIDSTFSTLVQNWNDFSPLVQQKAYDAVRDLLSGHSDLIRKNDTALPSLGSITVMSKFETQIARFRSGLDRTSRIESFNKRCKDEAPAVVLQALRELVPYLDSEQQWIHEVGTSEQPNPVLIELVRTLLDTCIRFKDNNDQIVVLCAECLGTIGSLDPNRLEITREKREIIVLSNFEQAQESIDFVTFLLENVLVKAFHSVSNPRAQGFLAYVMQELLKFCEFTKEVCTGYRPRETNSAEIFQRWDRMAPSVKSTLQPFLSSRYVLTTHSKHPEAQTYPIFSRELGHGTWLRNFVFDLLQKTNGENAKMIFGVLSRIIRGYDVAIAGFLLPFVAANVIMSGTDQNAKDVGDELRTVLSFQTADEDRAVRDHVRSCSENVFQVLDYLAKWVQEKKRTMTAARVLAARAGKTVPDLEEATGTAHIQRVEDILASIPAEITSDRAVECGSYSRALFHWEQYIRQVRRESSSDLGEEPLYERLQTIYAQIEEPDGMDGISAYLSILSQEQQVLEHVRSGRWAAAQSWYELELAREPENLQLHVDLLDCLQQAGQHHMVLDHALGLSKTNAQDRRVLSIVSKSSWYTSRWEDFEKFSLGAHLSAPSDFNIGLGKAFKFLRQKNHSKFSNTIRDVRLAVAKGLSDSNTASLQSCHDQMLKFHALYEVDALSNAPKAPMAVMAEMQLVYSQRLAVLGAYRGDKQYLLGIRRAVMEASNFDDFTPHVASSWMETAKLARKENWWSVAYDAVQHALELGDGAARIEQARLLWNEGEHRKAIKSLEGIIASEDFKAAADGSVSILPSLSTAAATSTRSGKQQEQNLLVAKANLLLAKWLDRAGQTQYLAVNKKYQFACKTYSRWEKGYYYLGKFYNKLLESEKALPVSKQSFSYLTGDTAKLVVENYLRSLMFGCKYLYHSVPKLLTLWLDFGVEALRKVAHDVSEEVRVKITNSRPQMLEAINKQVKKYGEKLPGYLLYTALPQMITRMGHENKQVYEVLAFIITRVVATYPQQGLWPLLAVVKSSNKERKERGTSILNKLKEKSKSIRNEGQNVDLKNLVIQGQKLSDQLLHACEVSLDGRANNVSLKRDLGLNPNTSCPLVVPLEQTLSASLPTTSDATQLRQQKAFPMSREAVTISSFQDEVLVLSSLQKPRRITVRASNGKKYSLLCKPNDDLRKDQRLMEFNAMINRSLKRDAEAGKRRLYIRTYAVTPLNEACGLIEWVDGLKPMRDILINSYRSKGIKVDYNLLRELLSEACSTENGHRIFTDQILPMYPPVLHEWFSDLFADPESWFAARLRYTRSCAVSSMVGYALGLGDRHGENVLLEEHSGGVFHVDFNCLFEKGLTFEKPELVPFRLTHNMVDAFGAYGVEGPFRRSAECAMKVMRAHEDALLTILETFVYDPTADFMGQRRKTVRGVPETPMEVLESVRSKARGLMKMEPVPLSVGGHVDALIQAAVDPKNLCAMYIGWCAFF